jgi:hypothetical protein
MDTIRDYATYAAIIGAAATATTDLWAIARKRFLGTPPPNYALVGRWIAYFPRGRFSHDSIAASPPLSGERVVGWITHYAVGMSFAALLLVICGIEWVRHPSLVSALAVGIGTVAAPFLVMQPGMGAGIAASRTPRPGAARIQSLLTHTVFGLGLYVAGLTLNLFLTH